MKKNFNVVMVVFLIMVFAVGCGSGKGSQSGSESEEFLGKYSGSAGSIEFLPDGQIKVDFSDDGVWLVNASSKNHTTYTYHFLTKKRKIVSYDMAEYLSFQVIGKKTSFIMHPCKVTKDKIVLYPGSVNEAVFNKIAN